MHMISYESYDTILYHMILVMHMIAYHIISYMIPYDRYMVAYDTIRYHMIHILI